MVSTAEICCYSILNIQDISYQYPYTRENGVSFPLWKDSAAILDEGMTRVTRVTLVRKYTVIVWNVLDTEVLKTVGGIEQYGTNLADYDNQARVWRG